MRARVVWVGKAGDDRVLKVHHQRCSSDASAGGNESAKAT